jgi:hypothetical protein
MAESDSGPNWFWRLCELWGVTWPGHAKVKGTQTGPAPRCSACRNPTVRDVRAGVWRCPYHPDAPLLDEAP